MKNLKPTVKHIFILTALIGIAAAFMMQPGKIHAQNQQPQKTESPRTAIKLPPPLEARPLAQDTLKIRKNNGEELYFNIELALTSRQQSQGLMYRTEMPEDSGMLFLFNSPIKTSFWMKNTLIPLDMLFVHPDGTIHHIHHNARPQDETSITSKFPAKAVLELNGGTADKMGIKEGDQIIHRLFNNDAAKP